MKHFDTESGLVLALVIMVSGLFLTGIYSLTVNANVAKHAMEQGYEQVYDPEYHTTLWKKVD